MKVKIRTVGIEPNGTQKIIDVQPYQMVIPEDAIMSIDGSTSNTGIAILRRKDGALYYSMAFEREKKDEDPVHYKLNMKRVLVQFFERFRNITHVIYEEPILGYATAIANLMMLRTLIPEIIAENEPKFNYLMFSEANNKKWKKTFLHPDKVPNNSEIEKAMVRRKLESFIPAMKDVTEDEVDAIAMGFSILMLHDGGEVMDELQSKKAVKAFQYNVDFIGADSFEGAFEEFAGCNNLGVPEKVLQNGMIIYHLGDREKFDKAVYREMGQEDKLLVLEFPSDKHGDVILKYRLGYTSEQFENIYAFAWRKSRKR